MINGIFQLIKLDYLVFFFVWFYFSNIIIYVSLVFVSKIGMMYE